MKKISFFGCALMMLLISGTAFSQSKSSNTNPMQLGSLFVNLGVGFGAGYQYGSYGTPFGFKASAEYGMWQAGPGVITIGPELGGTFSSANSYHNNTFVLAGRAAWHNGWDVPNLDTYGGFSAGVGFNNYTNDGKNHNSPFPYFGAFVGASYFITPSFGFNSELGVDITNFQVGVVLKID